MIAGSDIQSLDVHPDERGRLFEVLRCDDPAFMKFGQVYVTTAHPGIVKAWHCHSLQTDFFCLIDGRARFALYDAREDSATYGQIDEYICDGQPPQRIVIPPGVYHGFKNEGDRDAICVNCPTEPYNHEHPDELRIDAFDNDIPYDWNASGSGLKRL